MSTLGIFHGTASGRQTQDDAFLNHLTVANSATLNCTTLTASDNINCSALRVVGGDVELCNIKCSSILTILSKDNMNLISDLGNLTVNANKNITLVSDAGDINIQVSGGGNTFINGNNSGRLGFFAGTGVPSQLAGPAIGAVTAGQPLSGDVQAIANTLNSLRNGLLNYGLFFP